MHETAVFVKKDFKSSNEAFEEDEATDEDEATNDNEDLDEEYADIENTGEMFSTKNKSPIILNLNIIMPIKIYLGLVEAHRR